MTLAILLILGGLILLVVGAEGLVRGSSAIARRLGIAPLVIGLTIVAFGTGTPELLVSLGAALEGNSSIAIGNVVGSNIGNIGLILGTAAMVRPLIAGAEVIRREIPIMIAATVLLWLLILDGEIGRVDGLILTLSCVAYTAFNYWQARRNKQKFVEEEFEEAMPMPTRSIWFEVGMLIVGLGVLLVGARLLLDGAVFIAEDLGISQVVIGLTIVAIGTSMPELATSVVAAYKNEPDVALGNVIGSNVMNILAILGLTALILPISTVDIRTFDMSVMLGSALLGLLLIWSGFVLNRIEGAILVIAYIIYIYSLLTR
jgi:cation:H+ antiporter